MPLRIETTSWENRDGTSQGVSIERNEDTDWLCIRVSQNGKTWSRTLISKNRLHVTIRAGAEIETFKSNLVENPPIPAHFKDQL